MQTVRREHLYARRVLQLHASPTNFKVQLSASLYAAPLGWTIHSAEGIRCHRQVTLQNEIQGCIPDPGRPKAIGQVHPQGSGCKPGLNFAE